MSFSYCRVRWLAAGVVGAVAAALAACTTNAPSEPGTAPPPQVLNALPRSLTSSETGIIGSANAFSFALWNRLNAADPTSNLFVSPLSASFSLGMAMNGAAHRTYDEMRATLQFGTLAQAEIDSGYQSLMTLLPSLDPSVTMLVANSIWYDTGFPVNQSFINTGATMFDADVKPLDFQDVNGTLATINAWASAKTNGKIPTVLETLDPSEVMFLINAVYFKAGWRDTFDPAETHAAPFTAIDGTTQTVQLMHRQAHMSYAKEPTYQAVDLPYGDSAFTMTVLLPDSNVTVSQVAASLTPASWQALTNAFGSRLVDLSMPRMTLSWSRDLSDDLKALGMPTAFSDSADFSALSSQSSKIAFVKQNTYLTVDEEGTEAAAVTTTGVVATALEVPAVVRLDRPFILVIRERLSGTIVFMGKVVRLPAA